MKKQTKLGLVLAAAAVISVSVASLVSARGWVQQGADWYYVDNNGDYVTGTIQSSGNAKFYLDEDTGAMQRDYLLQNYNDNTYYFGSNGAMVTNTWVAVDSSIVDSNAEYIPDNFWFYFQASGKAVKSSGGTPKKTTIDGKKYAFSEDGTMLTGWITNDGKTVDPDSDTNPFSDAILYAGGDNDGVLRSGWVTYYDGYDGDKDIDYTNLYFYFNPSNNEKQESKNKKINGKTYYFNDEGIMLSGWDAADDTKGGSEDNDGTYFSGEDDGHQVKKGWIYAVPTAEMDEDANKDDEEKYMYFNASGAIVTDTFKKINGKYYVFNDAGIMKTGLVVWQKDNASAKFINTFDLDWANGSDLAKKGYIRYGSAETDIIKVGTASDVLDHGGSTAEDGKTIAIFNFADDGSRKDGTNTVTFADGDYTFVTNAAGHKPSGSFSKKYYSLGIQLKADADIKYGIFADSTIALKAQEVEYDSALPNGKYVVLNASGSKVKGKEQAVKDADGNYWLIDKNSSTLEGIWSVNVKHVHKTATFNTKSFKVNDEDLWGTTITTTSEAFADLRALFNNTADEFETVKSVEFTVKVDNTGYATAKGQIADAYWFQSDYGDKSNVWLPFSALDGAGKTCALAYDPDNSAYQVTPTNDYFLNCYWN